MEDYLENTWFMVQPMVQQTKTNHKEIKIQSDKQSDYIKDFAKRMIDGIENDEIKEILKEDWDFEETPEEAYDRAMKGI